MAFASVAWSARTKSVAISFALLFLSAQASIRGAEPAFAAITSAALRCVPLHGGKNAGAVSVPSHRINDNFCDCKDGADEPGTAACSNGRFWCVNVGYKGRSIPSSRVDDGVCDCCDGSDEPRGKCADHCAHLRNEAVKTASDAAAKIMAGVRIRRQYARKSSVETRKDAAELVKLEKDLEALKAKLVVSERQTETLKARQVHRAVPSDVDGNVDLTTEDNSDTDSEKLVDGDYGEPEELDSEGEESQGNNAEEDVEKLDAERADVSQSEEGVENHGDVMRDAVDITADASNKSDMEPFCEELSGNGKSIVVRKILLLLSSAVSKVHWIYPRFFERTGLMPSRDLDKCIQRAEDEKSLLEGKKRDLEEKISNLKKKSEYYYGTDGALRQLHGQCLKKKLTQYEFEHCPFDVVRQYEDGRMIASLGRFENVTDNDGDLRMIYKNGDHCWNGPERSISVTLRCGETNEVMSVDEPSRCTYQMQFITPAACTEDAAEKVLAEVSVSSSELKEEL